jgi:hypothetical protein
MPRLLTLLLLAVATAITTGVRADDAPPGEAWKSSPFHGTINGATGKAIPCFCRFQGRDFRLGASVCMQTHLGVVIAKCDLLLNNTTWAPTDQPCTLSWRIPQTPLKAPQG